MVLRSVISVKNVRRKMVAANEEIIVPTKIKKTPVAKKSGAVATVDVTPPTPLPAEAPLLKTKKRKVVKLAAPAAGAVAPPVVSAAEDTAAASSPVVYEELIKAGRIKTVLRELSGKPSADGSTMVATIRINRLVPGAVNKRLNELAASHVDALQITSNGTIAIPRVKPGDAPNILPSSTFKKHLKKQIKQRFDLNRVSGELLNVLQINIERDLVDVLKYSISCMENTPRKTLFEEDMILACKHPVYDLDRAHEPNVTAASA